MKSHDEFRRTVYEKAEQYKRKQQARRRKIIESASLCAICIVIVCSAYFGVERFQFDMGHNASENTKNPSIAATDGANVENAPSQDIQTTGLAQTTTACFTIATTSDNLSADATSAMLGVSDTLEATMATSTTALDFTTTDETSTEEMPVFSCTPEQILSCDASAYRVVTIENESVYLLSTPDEAQALTGQYNNAFFEENLLVILYVPNAWRSYEVTTKNGIFEQPSVAISEDGVEGFSVHVYVLPRKYEQQTVLLSYSGE